MRSASAREAVRPISPSPSRLPCFSTRSGSMSATPDKDFNRAGIRASANHLSQIEQQSRGLGQISLEAEPERLTLRIYNALSFIVLLAWTDLISSRCWPFYGLT